MSIKFIDDILKDEIGRWKAEKIWCNFALIAYHAMAYINRDKITLTEWVTAYVILHSALFLTNGAKAFLEKRPADKANISIDTTNTTVESQK